MPLFQYEAVDVRGAPQAGDLECGTRTAALELLQQRGLTPLCVAERSTAVRESFLRRLRQAGPGSLSATVSPGEIVSLTQSLAALLNAGLTIDRALGIMANFSGKGPLRNVLAELGKTVRAGRSFAEALAASRLVLPAYYVGMVQAGEVGGSLAQTMLRLAELLRKQQEVRERIRSALIYPALLGGVVLITIILLLTYVLPRFEELFAESEAPLPWPTRAVLAAGSFLSSYWWLIGSAGAAALVLALRFLRMPQGRRWCDAWLLRSPLTFGLPLSIEMARVLRTLGTLLANGVQIGSAMRIGRATLVNTVLQHGFDQAARRVKAGQSLSAALSAAGVFAAQAVQLVRVGEETGRLEQMLLEAATILEADSSTRLERLLALIVPALTVVMGLLIAGLIGSVLIGLLSVNDLAF